MPTNPIVIFLAFMMLKVILDIIVSWLWPSRKSEHFAADLIDWAGFAMTMTFILTVEPFPKWPIWLYILTVVMLQVPAIVLANWIRKRSRRGQC